MGFIESYKQLEKLCRELMADDRAISAYIDEMDNNFQGSRYVLSWNEDLKTLKHYRHIRNKIAHDPGCTEENMCDPEDALWLDDFYSRIMNQSDPLSLYHQATNPHFATKTAFKPIKTTSLASGNNIGCTGIAVISLLAIIFFILIFALTGCTKADGNPSSQTSGNISNSSSAEASSVPEINKNATILPDLTSFLGKSPTIEGKYQGGKRAQYKKLDETYREKATEELLSLLGEEKYQLKLKEKRVTGNDKLTDRYEFIYTGNASVSEISGKNDDYLFHVELAIYRDNKGEFFSVQLHWANEFVIDDSGKRVSVKLHDGISGSGSGGGGIADGEVDIPEFAKLDCLTCKGDGDCTRCGGDGYTGFGDAKAGCNRCHGNGKCTACNGTGKR